MNRTDAERILTEHLRPIYGFALKNCRTVQDAEDLSQEIALRAYRALLSRDDLADPGRFIGTVAHHTLCNYYRDLGRTSIGVPLDEIADVLADPDAGVGKEDSGEALSRLRAEIAYLSKTQRRIVIAFYFENKKQEQIAAELGIPLGTVKWHLFEAKKNLRKGMDTMRKASDLKFNPIRFESYGFNGNPGSTNPSRLFRSTLTQNICYCVRDRAKTVNEIADDLGVSPVYVEGEIEPLEEYGLLTRQKDRYIANFLIGLPTAELLTMRDRMYKKAAGIFANELYDRLVSSGILDDPDIRCGQEDKNFLLWTLIPYIAAWSGERLIEKRISFEEVATIRPDGGQNIANATVLPDGLVLPDDYLYCENFFGPCWNASGRGLLTLWQIDTPWSDRRLFSDSVSANARKVLSLYGRGADTPLSPDECAWLAERGYIRVSGAGADGKPRIDWQIVALGSVGIRERLIAMGDAVKEAHKAELDALKAPYIKADLESYPEHVRKMEEYQLQFLFASDGWFLFHCLHALLENGKLKLPTDEQKKSMTCLIYPN